MNTSDFDHPASMFPVTEYADESLSGMIELNRKTLRWVMPEGEDSRCGVEGACEAGLLPEFVRAMDDSQNASVPRLAVIDMALPTAPPLLRRYCQEPGGCVVLAVVRDQQDELAALKAGAYATMRRPLSKDSVVLHLRRMLEYATLTEQAMELADRRAVAERVETVGRIASGMAHEIANPLSVALSNAHILRDCVLDNAKTIAAIGEDMREVLSDMVEAIERMHRVVREVNMLSRGGTLSLIPVRLADVVRDAMEHTRNPNRVAITIQVTSDEVAMAQPDVLARVLENLLDNAMHALREVAEPRILVHVYRTASESRISVRDNGPGVPTTLRERIFEPFFTTKKSGGSGIGLAVCREFMTRMGGALTLARGEGGACMRVRLRPAPPP